MKLRTETLEVRVLELEDSMKALTLIVDSITVLLGRLTDIVDHYADATPAAISCTSLVAHCGQCCAEPANPLTIP